MIAEDLPGKTPLEEEESEGLLVPVSTREELDEFEQWNIEQAVEWTLGKKFRAEEILTEEFVRQLHRRMLGNVWSWAGQFRRTYKNLGIAPSQVAAALRQLNGDCAFWIGNETYPAEEIALRYKHRIVSIHCFSNGNGRHSRLMADILVSSVFRLPVFSWGRELLHRKGEVRGAYLLALKAADTGEMKPLLAFARS